MLLTNASRLEHSAPAVPQKPCDPWGGLPGASLRTNAISVSPERKVAAIVGRRMPGINEARKTSVPASSPPRLRTLDNNAAQRTRS